jgi:ligand-binding sensor domain-containing protein
VFDGQKETTYTRADGLPYIDIQALTLAADAAGQLWIGSRGGVSVFNGQTWINYTDKLVDNNVSDIAIDPSGRVWVSTFSGVSVFDGENWQSYTQAEIFDSQVMGVLSDQAGHIWVGAINGAKRFDGQNWTTYTSQNGLASNEVTLMALDSAGAVWFASVFKPGYISRFDGQSWRTYTTHDGLIDGPIKAMVSDEAGHLWVGSDQGLSEFDGQTWTPHLTTGELQANSISDIATDETGSVVVVYEENKQVSEFDGKVWTNYTILNGWPYYGSNTVAIDQAGHRWFGTDHYVSEFDGHTWRNYTGQDGVAGNWVGDIAIDAAGHKWFAVAGGVNKFDGQTWTTYLSGDDLAESWFNAIAVDNVGHVWVGSSDNLNEFDGQQWTTYTSQDGLAGNWIKAIAVDQAGHKWFATQIENEYGIQHGSGVSKFDGQTWRTYTTAAGLISDRVNTIAVDQAGHIWFGTNDGVSEFDGCTWNSYTTANGLARNWVKAIAIDQAGHKWFATLGGGLSELTDTHSTITLEADSAQHVSVRSLLVGPGQPGRLYALTQTKESKELAASLALLISDNFGQNWSPFPGDLPVAPACLHSLSLDYAAPDALYASTCQGLYRWSDGAWQLISSQEVEQVALPYGQPDVLWATAPAGPGDVPVFYSDNGAESWQPASRYLGHTQGVANLAFDPHDPNILYATIRPEYAGSYLRRGTANGQWEELPSPLNNSPIGMGFTLDGTSGALYVTTQQNGGQLWRSCQPRLTDAKAIQWEQLYNFGPEVHVELLASGWSPSGLALYVNLSSAQDGEPVLHRSLNGGHTWAPLKIKF